MKYKTIYLLCALLLLSSLSRAQDRIPVTQGNLPEAAPLLLLPDDELRGQPRETELVLDLVQAWMADSTLEKRRQRLSGMLGWMAQKLGSRYWEYLDPTKRKYVGTMSRPFKVYDGLADEYDLNIFLMPHLEHYVEMAWEGFQTALKRPRSEKHFRFDRPDYDCPEGLAYKDMGYLTIECEGTPNAAQRERLAEVFLPMAKGPHDLKQWPNTGTDYASFGMYGSWCMDCNHNCRPEIHPFEWLWWLDLSEDRPGSAQAKSWMIGVLRDGSGRFEDWSPAPQEGVLSLPVTVPVSARSLEVRWEHLLADKLFPERLAGLRLPSAALPSQPGKRQYVLPLEDSRNIAVALSIEGEKITEGISFWWSEFTMDERQGLLMGYLNVAISVEDVYAGRITVDYK